jgi:hypothetical protein
MITMPQLTIAAGGKIRQTYTVARAGVAAVAFGLALLAAGCGSGHQTPAGRASATESGPAARASNASLKATAARYLAIAEPANHSLDQEVDGYSDNEHSNLAAAEADLRAEASTEHRFDQLLAGISFPPPIAAIAVALIRANQARIELTKRQAGSASIAELLSFTGRHRAADAAVEVQVKIIRRDLGLPPPGNS